MARRALIFCMAALLLAFVAAGSNGDSIKIDIQLPGPFLETPSNNYKTVAKSIRRTIQQLTMPGFTSQMSSGDPALPCKTIYAALPPDADERSVKIELENSCVATLPGQYDVLPVPPAVICDKNEMQSSRNNSVYAANSFYPSNNAIIKSIGNLRTWKIVEIELWPCRYNPVSGSIRVLNSGSIRLKYKTKATARVSDPIAAEMGSFVSNFEQARAFYPVNQPAVAAQSVGYAIITTSGIAASSAKLAAFVAHQESRGFTVSVITQSAWGGGTGDSAANNIRNWLKTNYLSLGLSYVLLIGDPNPSTSIVPMKLLWPRRNQTDYRDAVSDYFYADLTGNWDRDADNYCGEYPDDFGAGGIDRIPELYVGRIPFYGEVSALDSILQKTIAYESDKPGNWSRNFLLPMKALDTTTPSYQLGEEISHDVAIPAQMIPRRAYDSAYGLNPTPECIPCDYAHVLSEWQTYGAGVVVWMSHGSAYMASGVLTSQNAALLDNSKPAVVFCASCDNGYPESSSNLGYALLKNGAVCTQSASRVAWYYPGAIFKGTDSIGGMAYEYSKHLITNGESCGKAAYESRVSLPLTIWMNHLVFNIYGDPSLALNTSAFAGIIGIVTDTAGNPIAGAYVRTADGAKQAMTSSDGTYSLIGIGVTSVDLIISADGYYTQRYYDVSATGGISQVLNFQLVPANYGSIDGYVRDESGAPLPNASICIVGTTRTAVSTSDGAYTIDHMEPGAYSIVASKEGYAETMAANFRIEEAKSTPIDITLRFDVTATIPAVPWVTLNKRYIRPDEQITASWTAGATSDHYEYAVATSINPISIIAGGEWRSAGTATSAAISGLNLHNGNLVYLLVRAISSAGIAGDIGISAGVRVIYEVGSIAEARLMEDGTWIRLSQLIVSRMGSENECYLQSSKGLAGIKIAGSPKTIPYVAPGTIATTIGCLTSSQNMRELCQAEAMPSLVKSAPRPLGMRNSAVGGGATIAQNGSVWGRGVNNVGILVKVWGRVTAITENSFLINDGSLAPGIQIYCAGTATSPRKDCYVSVTGIATPNGVTACSANDITELR